MIFEKASQNGMPFLFLNILATRRAFRDRDWTK